VKVKQQAKMMEALPGCRWGKPESKDSTDDSRGRELTPEVALKNGASAHAHSITLLPEWKPKYERAH
jgi:hypothetical protein